MDEGPARVRHGGQSISSLRAASAGPRNRLSHPEPSIDLAQTMVEATIEFAFAIARTDSSNSRKEKELIEEEMQRRYSYDPVLYNRARAWCAHYEAAAIDIQSCLRRIKENFSEGHRVKLLEFACQIAGVSGEMNQREVRLLERASREWCVPWKPTGSPLSAVPDSPIPALTPIAVVAQPSSTFDDSRALLEIDSSAQITCDLIRRQYNLLSSRLAPEKVESIGSDFVALANAKRIAIRSAAEELIRPLGEPLVLPEQEAAPADLRRNPDLDAMFG